ncbi:MAG: 6-phosphogluconolactonase [Myxococcales bacterium]|nr:6-phosphogluconolactonase [Myxococcales bacterium]
MSSPSRPERWPPPSSQPPSTSAVLLTSRSPAVHARRDVSTLAESGLDIEQKISDAHVFRMLGELGAEAGARAYTEVLDAELGAGAPMDLVIAGLGNDGHTASLFPGTGAVRLPGRVVAVTPGGGSSRASASGATCCSRRGECCYWSVALANAPPWSRPSRPGTRT